MERQLSSDCCGPLFSELLQCMLGGMQSHLDSSVVRIRHMGMVVGECLSSCMNINGTKLKFEVITMFTFLLIFPNDSCLRWRCGSCLSFYHAVLQYDQDEETQELLSLMKPCAGDQSESENGYVFYIIKQGKMSFLIFSGNLFASM